MKYCVGAIMTLLILTLFAVIIGQISYEDARFEVKKDICQMTAISKESYDKCLTENLDSLIFKLVKKESEK